MPDNNFIDVLKDTALSEGKILLNDALKQLGGDLKLIGKDAVQFGKVTATLFAKKVAGTITAAEYDEGINNIWLATRSELLVQGYDKAAMLGDFLMRSLKHLGNIVTTVLGKVKIV